jgi:hypothetical protein
MRRLVMLVVTASCNTKPTAPDPAKFAAMDETAKCEATVPRTRECMDEVLLAQLASLQGTGIDKEGIDAISADWRAKEKADADEASVLHRTSCQASPRYADAVFACWAQPDCKRLAKCVMEKDAGVTPRP